MLKPQDIVIIGKVLAKGDEPWSQGGLAVELDMSPSEINAGIKRAVKSGLMRKDDGGYHLVKPAIEEFLCHGLKYVFPAERGEPTRGMPTGYAAPPLRNQIAPGKDLPPVWPDAAGKRRGYALKPLYRSVPIAASRDRDLYAFLAVADALRNGKAREQAVAKREISRLLS